MTKQRKPQICDGTDYSDGTVQQEYAAQHTNLGNLDKRYRKAAQASAKALFEQLGEDLSSSSEERTRSAAATACHQLAERGAHLMDMVDARETHHEGWLHERGNDQRFAKEGIDYSSRVYTELVKKNSQLHKVADLDFLHSLNLPERYSRVALASGFTKPWFDLIDEDFSNTLQEVREIAWTAFNFSYLAKLEEEMDREGTQDVYVRCYEKLVKEGVFTRPRKHKSAKVYFNFALDNARKNQRTRRPDPLLLNRVSRRRGAA